MTTFLNVPVGAPADLGPGAIALLGVCNATPYEAGRPSRFGERACGDAGGERQIRRLAQPFRL